MVDRLCSADNVKLIVARSYGLLGYLRVKPPPPPLPGIELRKEQDVRGRCRGQGWACPAHCNLKRPQTLPRMPVLAKATAYGLG